MQAISLSDELVTEYLNFRHDSKFDKDLVTKLFKYIQPALVSICQNTVFNDPSAVSQFSADPIIKLTNTPDEIKNVAQHLVEQTSLKLQLVTKKDSTANFTQLNINAPSENFERLDMLLAGTYIEKKHKQEAINHIKALIANAKFVKVTDKYLQENNSWQQCKDVLEAILPKQNILLKFISMDFNKHKDLKAICSDWTVKGEKISSNTHDRYIETDKLIIMLSSGILHLSTNSTTDLTYVVKIKK